MKPSRVRWIVHFAVMCGVGAAVVSNGLGCSTRRAPVDEATLLQRAAAYESAAEDVYYQAAKRLVHRLKRELDAYSEGRRPTRPILNVLVLSGGADFGAFGAGFLKGWGAVNDPDLGRPSFDVVNGVSTGALIAPFAFLGDDESYAHAVELYTTPRSDWFRRRGPLFFLPSQQSLVRIDGLERDIKAEFSVEFVRRVGEEGAGGRLLGVLATNLDLGRRRAWDLAYEVRKLPPDQAADRMVSILLASAAVPGAFPAVEIDGYLYADGALSSNIMYSDAMRSSRGLTSIWATEFPGVVMPLTRYWVIINGQLEGVPQITQPTWISVSSAGLSTALRSATNTNLQNLGAQLELINLSGAGSKELRVVSIPNDWREPAQGRFQPETMRALAELGERMGADPSSWRTIVTASLKGSPTTQTGVFGP